MIGIDGVLDGGEYPLEMQRRIVFFNLQQFRGRALRGADVGNPF